MREGVAVEREVKRESKVAGWGGGKVRLSLFFWIHDQKGVERVERG